MDEGDIQEELKRRIDFQIEENRHLEAQAGRILRVWLLLIGALATIAIAVLSGRINPPEPETAPGNAQPEAIAEVLPFFNADLASLVWLFAFSISFILFSISLSDIFLRSPLAAIEVLKLSELEPNPEIKSQKGLDRSQLPDLTRGYKDYVEKNSVELENTRESWDKCQHSLNRGVKFMGASIFALMVIFIAFNVYLALLSFITVAYIAAATIYRNSDIIRPYVDLDKHIDGVLGVTILLGTIALTLIDRMGMPDELIFLPIISIFTTIPIISKMQKEKLRQLIIRTFGMVILSILFMFGTTIATPIGSAPLYMDVLFFITLSCVISTFVLSSFMSVFYATLASWDRILKFMNEHQLR